MLTDPINSRFVGKQEVILTERTELKTPPELTACEASNSSV